MFMIVAVILFTVYIINVLVGAWFASPFLNDIGEMLLLFAASLVFVVVILRREQAAKERE